MIGPLFIPIWACAGNTLKCKRRYLNRRVYSDGRMLGVKDNMVQFYSSLEESLEFLNTI